MSSMVLIAGMGNVVELIIFLVIGGIAVINKILAKQRDAEPPPRPDLRPIPPRQRPNLYAEPVEPKSIDQYLDQVLRGGPIADAQPPAPPPRPPSVIVLQPGKPIPPKPPVRPRPETRRPPNRPAKPQAIRAVQSPAIQPPPLVKPTLDLMQSAKEAVSRAAEAAQTAASLQQIAPQATRAPLPRIGTSELQALLRSPADIRRAIILREILGPPVAHRRHRV